MSPAPVVTETQQNLQLQTLAKAFEALLLTVHQLNNKERNLQQRLKYSHDEVNITSYHPFTSSQPPLSPNDEKI